jgi:hypothetical protein
LKIDIEEMTPAKMPLKYYLTTTHIATSLVRALVDSKALKPDNATMIPTMKINSTG